jgi:hypothetical protein
MLAITSNRRLLLSTPANKNSGIWATGYKRRASDS